ncbi:MAG TPA: ATP-binding protein [Patescibacteria group bacterium]|nr:ATP-binding protein [Patescibacteria group bacterium]
MQGFVGRTRDLAVLRDELAAVNETGAGRFVVIRGRRRVGKTWLIEEFLEQQQLPHVYFAATRRTSERELRLFAQALAISGLPVGEGAEGLAFEDWGTALATASAGTDRARPTAIVIDEFPYLSADDPGVEGSIQAAWDRTLSRRPVLLILAGSDLSMMEALGAYGSPLFGRPTRELIVEPLEPAELAEIARLEPPAAIDAYAVVGGFPQLAQLWPKGGSVRTFLGQALAHPDTPFVLGGARILDAEFPGEVQARTVLSVIGSGERAPSAIANGAGLPASNLDRSLKFLSTTKRMIRIDQPLAAKPLRAPRYSVADPYLRFWLRFIEPALGEIERRRGDDVAERVVAQWPAYRGRAVEPIIRAALERLLPSDRFPDAKYVGGYWTRRNQPEIDLIGADRPAAPARVGFVGSIKWRERAPFDDRDRAILAADAAKVPGVSLATPLVAVSRSGFRDVAGMAAVLDPDQLVGGT